MSKQKYWLGEGVLTIKDKDGKRKDLEYASPIPEDALTPERIKTLMKHGVIGERPIPQKASETARLQNKVETLQGELTALRAGEDGKAVGRVDELEEENKRLQTTITELETQVSEFETLKATMVKEAQDLQDVLKKAGIKDEKSGGSGGGVGPKDKQSGGSK